MESKKTEVGPWLAAARQRLNLVDNPALEAQVILAFVLQQSKTAILAHPEWVLAPAQLENLDRLLARRITGEPLPYILGRWEFYGLNFTVTPEVLIPRPETELMVDLALHWLKAHPDRRLAADAGTGSSAISTALLTHVPDLRIIAADISRGALQVAKTNLMAHGVFSRCLLLQTDLLSPCSGPFDLVCANLPYIPTQTLSTLEVSHHEPPAALDGGGDGLRVVETLLADAGRWLAPGSLMLLEIEATQGQSVPELARRYFPSAVVDLHLDLAGLPRLVSITL